MKSICIWCNSHLSNLKSRSLIGNNPFDSSTYFALFDNVIWIWSRKTCTFEHIDYIRFAEKKRFYSKGNRLKIFDFSLDNFTIEKVVIFFTTNLSSNSNFRFINLVETRSSYVGCWSGFTHHNTTIRIIKYNFNISI